MRSEGSAGPYQLFMLVLCVMALILLAIDTFVPAGEDTETILSVADTLICVLFLIDFLVSLISAPNRWRYLRTWGWIDLLSSIPAVNLARLGRAARVLRILRVLRGVRATKVLSSFILEKRAESAVLAAAILTLLLLVFSSIAVLGLERGVENANIRTAEDALWWAVATVTTVGYGDRYPITTEGRVIAGILMIAGVGLFGTFSGFVASWFLAPRRGNEAK
ncbi:MAG TPA: ion transporter [bacterium]|nr:ion transporter [bacterium]